ELATCDRVYGAINEFHRVGCISFSFQSQFVGDRKSAPGLPNALKWTRGFSSAGWPNGVCKSAKRQNVSGLPPECIRVLREVIAYVTPHHGAVCVFGLSRCDKPRRARKIANLVDQLEKTILRVFPKGNDPISSWFLNGSVSRVGGARPAEPDKS